MVTLEECQKHLIKLSNDIEQLLKAARYDPYFSDELKGVQYDRTDPQEIFMKDFFENLFEKLSIVKNIMRYLQRPVSKTGRLYENDNGRMMLGDIEFSCGSCVEVLVDIDPYEPERGKHWLYSRIEAESGKGYYLVEEPSIPMEGLEARIRE